MMCYKDITFCPYYKICKDGEDCEIALTDKVKADARDWWGNDEAPIAIYTEKQDCFKDK